MKKHSSTRQTVILGILGAVVTALVTFFLNRACDTERPAADRPPPVTPVRSVKIDNRGAVINNVINSGSINISTQTIIANGNTGNINQGNTVNQSIESASIQNPEQSPTQPPPKPVSLTLGLGRSDSAFGGDVQIHLQNVKDRIPLIATVQLTVAGYNREEFSRAEHETLVRDRGGYTVRLTKLSVTHATFEITKK